jgi:cellulase/cellobiase CelA1
MVSYVLNAGGRLDSVFGAIAALPHFVRRLGEDGETDAPPVGSGQLPPLDDDTEYPGGEPGGGGSGTPGVTTDITLDDWGTGYCAYVEVTNGGSEAVTWEVVLTLDGTIDNFWNATMTDLGGSQYSFAGLEWNSSLAAGATLEFGVCGAR